MGTVPSTPRGSVLTQDTVEHLIGIFVGEKSLPLSSDFWEKLVELPLTPQWPQQQVRQACQIFAQNNYYTRHLAKILIHLARCLQESITTSSGSSVVYMKAVNAAYISSTFLKYLLEISKSNNFEELYLSLDEGEAAPEDFRRDQNIVNFVMHGVLSFIGMSDVSSHTFLLHHELLNFMLVAMSTQLCYAPSPGPTDVHPFIDAAMTQESSLVGLVVRKLLLNYITRPYFPLNNASYSIFSGGDQPGVLQKVGSTTANFILLPYNYLVSSTEEGSRSSFAENSLLVLLILNHYRKFGMVDESIKDKSDDGASLASLLKENSYFSDNPYCKALENARDIDLDRVDIEGNAHSGPLVRLPFASLFDTLGLIHKLILPTVPWYQERLLHHTSLGSLMVIILTGIVNYNLSKLQDVYLHTNCLATLANMSPHVHRLSAYASQRLVGLFNMLSRKYTKLSELRNDKMLVSKASSIDGSSVTEDMLVELHIYTDFLRIVLEILNAILIYAMTRNPEVVYAIMQRQEVFQPFKNHPCFNELLENIYTVLNFFNSRMDAQRLEGDWSVEKVLEVIITNCRSWRGDGMKMFTQLRFTYEQENHPEEFFVPYVWQLVLSHRGFSFNPGAINLFAVPVEDACAEEDTDKSQLVN